MKVTRRSLGTDRTSENEPQKRRSLGNSPKFPSLYPRLTETVSYASESAQITSEEQDDDDELETDHDTSFDSSRWSEASSARDNQSVWEMGFAVIGVIFVAILIGWAFKEQQGTQMDTGYEGYIKGVRAVIKEQFPQLSIENREILKLIGRKVFLEPENQAPLVVLVGGKDARQFSEAIASTFQSSEKETTIHVEDDTNRADFHERLRKVLSPTDATSSAHLPHSAVILDVDLLKWDAVLVLHAFADHENYPVPKTVLFLTVSDGNETDEENCDNKMFNYLMERWTENGGSSDNIPPIIARISYFLCV